MKPDAQQKGAGCSLGCAVYIQFKTCREVEGLVGPLVDSGVLLVEALQECVADACDVDAREDMIQFVRQVRARASICEVAEASGCIKGTFVNSWPQGMQVLSRPSSGLYQAAPSSLAVFLRTGAYTAGTWWSCVGAHAACCLPLGGIVAQKPCRTAARKALSAMQ